LKSGLSTGDHVELVVHQFEGLVSSNSDGHTSFVRICLKMKTK
jgi:hypothetical protein